MNRRPRMPKVWWLPFGYKIEIEQARIGCSGLWLAGEKGGLIQIRHNDPFLEKIDTLGHEMQHALIKAPHGVAQPAPQMALAPAVILEVRWLLGRVV